MEKFDYYKDVTEDVLYFINENAEDLISKELLDGYFNSEINSDEKQHLFEFLDNACRQNDVTGNMSGSKTMNRFIAEENICHNFDLLNEALEEFGYSENALKIIKSAEMCDIICREYVLSEVIDHILENKDLMKQTCYGITIENFQEKLQKKLEKQNRNFDNIKNIANDLINKMPLEEVKKFDSLLIQKGCTNQEKTEKFFEKLATTEKQLLISPKEINNRNR